MGMKEGTIYLGKGGRVFGPFTAERLAELRLSGEIEQYTYLWDDKENEWRNIDPVPPPPGVETPRKRPSTSLEMSEAICYDANEIVSGILENVTDGGCELVSHSHADAPKLALNTPLMLNVLDSDGEQAMNVKAALSTISRREGAWVYRIRWARRPSF
jgi:hypothetical protein